MESQERFPDPEAVFRAAAQRMLLGVWIAMPGYVLSFDPDKVTAQVQIGIKAQALQRDNSVQPVEIKPLADVPVLFPRGGGCTLTFPVKEGDECLVVFASRSIDAWWQSGGIQNPTDSRTHSLADGFAIVGPMSQANKIADIDPDKVQLRSDDASTLIELDPAGQTVRIVAPGGITLDGDVHVTGAVTGDSTADFDGDVHGNGTSLHTHEHGGVQTGSGNTGGPV